MSINHDNQCDGGVEKENKPVVIRNRDIPLLANVLFTIQDVSSTELLRICLQDRLYNISAKLTGMPRGSGDSGGLDRYFGEIGEIEEEYKSKLDEFTKELKQAEEIINGIKSRTMKTFVVMRYLMRISNNEIMRHLNIKRRTFEAMCRSVEDAPDMKSVIWKERFKVKC